MQKLILAIDLGTTSCKIALFDSDLNKIGESSRSYSTDYRAPGWAEQSPLKWWRSVLSGMEELFSSASRDIKAVSCIGIDSMGCALIPVDRQGEALCPAMLWMDRRAEQEAREIGDELAELLPVINGNRSDPSNIAPKILWLKRHHPEIYRKTETFLQANAYLIMKLTGKKSMNITECGLSQLCHTGRREWDDTLISSCGIDREKLPPLYECHDIVGTVQKEAAGLTGLPEGVPVVAGAMDMCSAALGAGVYKPGQVYISAGTVTAVGACLKEPAFHPDLQIYPHIVPGLSISAAGVDYGGAGLKWFKELLELEDFSRIDESIPPADEGPPLLFLPYMVGQRAPLWNSSMSGAIAGLHPSTGRGEMYRMFMQGTAFAVRRIINILKEAGHRMDSVMITGGCSKSVPWMEIFSNATGLPFLVPSSGDVAVRGAACIAAVGSGLKEDYHSLLQHQSIRSAYYPEKSKSDYNESLYRIYNDFLEAMLPVMHSLAELQNKKDVHKA